MHLRGFVAQHVSCGRILVRKGHQWSLWRVPVEEGRIRCLQLSQIDALLQVLARFVEVLAMDFTLLTSYTFALFRREKDVVLLFLQF